MADKTPPSPGILASRSDQMEQEINHIQANLTSINKNLPQIKAEASAASKLVEISEKNLAAPNWVLGMVVSVLGLFMSGAGLAGYFVRKDLLEKINNEVVAMEKLQAEIKEWHFPIVAAQCDREAIDEWTENRVSRAIEIEQKAISFLMKTPNYKERNYFLAKYKSNLAYFYAEDNRKDKRGEAIAYAETGLQAGKDNDNLDLIDNYLFVVMRLSNSSDDRKKWAENFRIYRERIYKDIRTDNEIEQYEGYYRECLEFL